MMSEADTLGSIFFAMLFFHSYALGPIDEGAPPRYHVIIDETHRFVKAPIQQMFSEARKYGLSLIMADQWLGQLEEHTREGIINNKKARRSALRSLPIRPRTPPGFSNRMSRRMISLNKVKGRPPLPPSTMRKRCLRSRSEPCRHPLYFMMW
jgi:hypothetical protein